MWTRRAAVRLIVTELKALTREKDRKRERERQTRATGRCETHEKERKCRIASPAYRVREYT